MIFDNLDILIIKQKFYILVLKKNPSLILGYEF
jgi:hypothetical protein